MTVTIHLGNVMDRLAEMPANSVHCVVTSPPYWGLRSYGTVPQVWGGKAECGHRWGGTLRSAKANEVKGPTNQGKIGGRYASMGKEAGNLCTRCGAWRGEHGQEPTLELWLAHEVAIFREVRRVLRPDGTLWLNIGDAYAGDANGRSAAATKATGNDDRTFVDKPFSTASKALPAKNRLMLPARLALALQADGWWLRDEIVWSKINPMPSSVKDRTCPAHEMVYLMTKRARYFFDEAAMREPCSGGAHPGRSDGETVKAIDGGYGYDNRVGTLKKTYLPTTRLKRSVWPLATQPYPDAHFATFPENLIRPMIDAGTSAKGCCPACAAPWGRIVRRKVVKAKHKPSSNWSAPPGAHGTVHPDGREKAPKAEQMTELVTLGWRQTCKCPASEPVACTVLDPFGGSGTTGLVADQLGRDAVLIELNPDYAAMAQARIREALGRVSSNIAQPSDDDLPLFGAVAA